MTDINILFFELIQVSIGTRICLSHTPSADEWGELYAMAKKQSLVGVCFAGVQKLQTHRQEPPEMLYLTWMGMAAKIQQRNEVVNKQCCELQKRLTAEGQCSCILKGQGVATLYSEHLRGLRQSGDIDVWVPGLYSDTLKHIQNIGTLGAVTAMHAVLNVYDDTEVEVHPLPAHFRCFWIDKRWRRFCDLHEADWIYKDDYYMPSMDFNIVFLMVHMYQHVLREGIGLRQFLDYYFCLLAFFSSEQGYNKRAELVKTIESLGMIHFAMGVMYIMKVIFGMKDDFLLVEIDKAAGKKLLDEIMIGGNFGHYDDRNKPVFNGESSPFRRVLISQKRNIRFLEFGFGEVVCSPIWRLWHWCWRKKHDLI